MRVIHDHHSETGRQELAEACLHEAKRRRRLELAGDFFCQAMHESREERRNGYNARQLAWQAAGHLLQKMKASAERSPAHFSGDAVAAETWTDRGDTWVRQIEFAFDLYHAIGGQLAIHRARLILMLRQLVRAPLRTSRAAMPSIHVHRGPLADRIRRRLDVTAA